MSSTLLRLTVWVLVALSFMQFLMNRYQLKINAALIERISILENR